MSYHGTIDLSALMSCTLPLQVDGIQWSEDAQVVQDVGRTATTIKAEGHGFIASTSAAALAADIATLESTSRVSGQDFNLVGTGGTTLHSVLATDCYEGGPHISFTVLDGDGGFYRQVKFTVTAKCHYAQMLHNWRLRIATGLDGLVVVSQQGSLQPAASSTLFATTVLPAFKAAYPPDQYLITYEVDYANGHQISEAGAETDISDETTRYRISGVQLAGSLPAGGNVVVVDGEVTRRLETDEQQRQTIVTDYEVQLQPNTGDYMTLVAAMRPAQGGLGETQLISESVSFSRVKAWRLKASFTQLGSADNNGLLNYTQTIDYVPNEQSYETYTYPGIQPIAVARPTTFTRVSQSGSLTALGEFLPAPSPVLETYENPPHYRYTDISKTEKRTDWEYQLLDVTNFADIQSFLSLIRRPSTVGVGVI